MSGRVEGVVELIRATFAAVHTCLQGGGGSLVAKFSRAAATME